ncbi:major facilitator superfamily domain-containing protein [Neurospora hispaniola]|uniref:Major facilitator superfamily domain-containing protein n=1 Tax=Neurospora hispaniola TaxID=588809 RepID=A0AAJ0MMV0_9PEZI|nr:major facilitator superfamily domain-containing protein [Neurospora hispaniola]
MATNTYPPGGMDTGGLDIESKASAYHSEKVPSASTSSSSPNPDVAAVAVITSGTSGADFNISPTEEKRIKRHIDRRLVMTIGAMYCVSLMDRTNLGAANIAGMGKELKLIDNRYSIVSLVFFVTYVLFQPPSTVICRKIGPRIHMSALTLLWGSVMIGMGFVKSWEQLAALRVVLGVLEAGFFPSCVYLLSTWYTRYEVGKRNSVFYLTGCVASAFAGILAYGLMQMGGLANLTGWRWIFIIEGVLTCLLGIAGYWLLVDFPDSPRKTWSFLSARDREWVCARVQADRGDVVPQKFVISKYLSSGRDWKVWAYAMIFFNTTTISYALSFFLPMILNTGMGFNIAQSQCLVAPPYAFAGFVMFAGAYVGDRFRIRGPIVAFNALLAVIGVPIMGFAASAKVRYFGVFLVTAGANSNVPAAMSYQANNIRGQWKRAFCSATFVSFGGIGGIAGSLVFREQDKLTGYKPGLYACIATSLLTLVLVACLTVSFWRENKKAERGEKELEAEDDDAQPGFRYTY